MIYNYKGYDRSYVPPELPSPLQPCAPQQCVVNGQCNIFSSYSNISCGGGIYMLFTGILGNI
jgi:hypothetical protein